MARGRGEAEDRWWVRDLAGYDDPISLDPLRMLRYPPFELRADLALAHGTNSDWFDGKVLATYLISSGNFFHPMSRREVGREECEALDQYLRVHGLGKPAVTEAYDQREAYGSPEGMPPDSRVYALRAEADMLLQALFSAQHTRREEGARSAHRRAAGEAVVREGNFALVDDDQRPSHATGREEEAAAGREECGGAARTVPGAELSRPAAATPRCASHDRPTGGAAAADAAEAESFPALVSERLPPREEAAWLPAPGGARSARFAATGATTRGRPAAWAAAAAHAPPHRTAAHMPTRAPAAQPLTLVSRAPTSTVPAPAAAPKKTKGQRKAAAKQRKAAASAGASASVGSDGESDGEEEGVGAAEGSGDAAASSAWSAAPRLPSDMEEIKARNKLLLLALRRRLAEGGMVEEAAGQLLAAFKEASAAYMASGGAGAREYIDAFLQLFGVEGSAPLLLELGALLPSSTLRHAFNAALRAMWGLPQLEAPSAASSSHAPPPSPAPPSVATPPHRTSAGGAPSHSSSSWGGTGDAPSHSSCGGGAPSHRSNSGSSGGGAPSHCSSSWGAPSHCSSAGGATSHCSSSWGAPSHCSSAGGATSHCSSSWGAPSHCSSAGGATSHCSSSWGAPSHCSSAGGATSHCSSSWGAPSQGPRVQQVESAPCGTPAPSVWTTRPPLPQKTAPKPAAPPKPKPPKAKPSQSAPAPAPPPPAAPVSAASISSAIFGNMSAVSAAAAASAAAELENSVTAAKAAAGYASKQPKPKGRR